MDTELFIAWQREDGMRPVLSDEWLSAAFDEGARYRQATEMLCGFPIWSVAEVYATGA